MTLKIRNCFFSICFFVFEGHVCAKASAEQEKVTKNSIFSKMQFCEFLYRSNDSFFESFELRFFLFKIGFFLFKIGFLLFNFLKIKLPSKKRKINKFIGCSARVLLGSLRFFLWGLEGRRRVSGHGWPRELRAATGGSDVSFH